MSPEAQRIAIAEACGWKRDGIWASGYLAGWIAWKSPGQPDHIRHDRLPDYTADLNAMHEAEKVLTEEQQISFVRHLVGSDSHFEALNKLDSERFSDRETVVENHLHGLGWDEVWVFCLRATAAQRAEAFLRTIGKWEEGKP